MEKTKIKTTKITEETFAQPNAGEIILDLVKKGAKISKDCELKIFDLPNAQEVALEYIRHGNCFRDKAELKIFDLPNAPEVALEYIALQRSRAQNL